MKSTKVFNRKYFKKLPAGLIILLLLFGGAIFFFTSIIHEVFWDNEQEADHIILNFFASITNSRLTAFMKGVTYFASSGFLQIAYAVIVAVYLLLKNWKRAMEIACIGLGGFAVNYFMKIFFSTCPSTRSTC